MLPISGETKDVLYTLIEFYLSLVAYFILHMIFVIASDFVEAFNIPPLNIGIYVDKMAAIRALLMVLSDFVEWGITQKGCNDGGNANQSLFKQTEKNKDNWFTFENLREKNEGEASAADPKKHWNNPGTILGGARRWASIISFVGMLVCRCVYLYLVYYSDNKSLSVFITLCLEGFWFGLFQMGFFAIGPEFNAYTSFGIHTMGNIIFFMQVILNYYAKSKPKINCLYRVRVHAWIVVVTSIIGLILWVCFCFWANAGTGSTPNNWPEHSDVWSPFLLFIVGAFAEDFAVPGILPFAFLDPEKANLVNYLTPSFFMSGALVTVFFNDWWNTSNFKEWSASQAPGDDSGKPWHSLWLLNIPKYIAFFISMWSIHGTYDSLRCIIQSRWRVMMLTLTVVVPRAWLETAGYVGVANWAIGRGDFGLVDAEYDRTMAARLKDSATNFPVAASTLAGANGLGKEEVKNAIANWVNFTYWSKIKAENISATKEDTGGSGKVKVQFTGGGTGEGTSSQTVISDPGKDVKVTINVNSDNKGNLNTSNNTDAEKIAKRIASLVMLSVLAKKLANQSVTKLSDLDAQNLSQAINNDDVKKAIVQMVKEFGVTGVSSSSHVTVGSSENTVNVTLGEAGVGSATNQGTAATVKGTGVKIQIKNKTDVTGLDDNGKKIAERLAEDVRDAVMGEGKDDARPDFGAFDWIAWHDVVAMFCRFVYGKFAVGYNWTRVSLGYCLPKFRPRHKGFGFGFWWWVGRTLSRAWADTVKDFKADIKCYL